MSNTHAETFRRLHDGPDIFVLSNCWDAGSARLLESRGARAVATTSAGVAWSNGYPDGDAIPVDRLASSVRTIVNVLNVPLSVDVEGGYSESPDAVGETIHALIDVGVVGINIEDGAASPDLLAAKIARIKSVAARAGVDLFVNARTDVYLAALVPETERVAETQRRSKQYEDAGADALFVPALVDPAEIKAIASSTPLPLGVLAWPNLADARALQSFGVRRLSTGSALAQIAYGRAASAATAFLGDGASAHLAEGAIAFAEMNRLFPRR